MLSVQLRVRSGWLALLVVLAGCGGFGAGSPTPPTVTPVPIPSDQSEPTVAGNMPPGVSETGIRNVTALSQAHASVLSETSFTRHATLTIRYLNGTELLGANRTLRMAASGDRFYYRETRTGSWTERPGDPVRITVWSTGDAVHRVIQFRNGTVLNTTNGRPASDIPRQVSRPSGDEIRSVFGGVNVEVVGPPEANGSSIVVEAADVSSTVLPLFPTPHGNALLRARISEAGLVRYVLVESISRRGRLALRIRWGIEYSAIGETDIDGPAQTTPINASGTSVS